MSKPELFIIESLGFDDEKNNLYEGRVISDILHLSDKKCIYYYIRTKAEFDEVIDIFEDSEYRYLHISCHGSRSSMHTTLDDIPFTDLAQILKPVLNKRRLFLSACSMANISLAKKIIPNSGCFSIIGPKKEIDFNDAAILWASFYHLMFKSNAKSMNHLQVKKTTQKVSSMFKVPLHYYHKSTSKLGLTSQLIRP